MFQWLRTFLSGLERPWQGILLLLAGVLAGIGWVAWQERQVIEDIARETFTERRLDLENVRDQAERALLIGDIFIVHKVDLGLNAQEVVYVHARAGLTTDGLTGLVIPFVLDDTRTDVVIAALSGDAVCLDYENQPSLSALGVWMAEQGYVSTCGMKLPQPEPGVIGLMQIGWQEKPTPQQIGSAQVILREIAPELTR